VGSGGPLFFAHYSYLGFDPHSLTDLYTNYFENNKQMATINRAYCIANPEKRKGYGAEAWGLTAADGPRGYNPSAPDKEHDQGTIAPTGALASFLLRIRDIQFAIVDMLQFGLRNVLLLRAAVLATVLDTLSVAGNVAASVVGIVAAVVDTVDGDARRPSRRSRAVSFAAPGRARRSLIRAPLSDRHWV